MDSFGFFCGLLAATFAPGPRELTLTLELATPYAHAADGFAICMEPGELVAMAVPGYVFFFFFFFFFFF
jgi:hypothetical protein